MMRGLNLLGMRAIVPMIAAVALLCVTLPAPARAGDCDLPFNGTYTAFSDGVWAKTHESFHDEVSVTAIWTVATECSSYIRCTGTVVSDQGWSAPATCRSGTWTVPHDVPNWELCPDGTAATGRQTFNFSASLSDPTGLDGWDKTVGPSGACGINRWLTVHMPFKLTKR
jgi:hypothetical protein